MNERGTYGNGIPLRGGSLYSSPPWGGAPDPTATGWPYHGPRAFHGHEAPAFGRQGSWPPRREAGKLGHGGLLILGEDNARGSYGRRTYVGAGPQTYSDMFVAQLNAYSAIRGAVPNPIGVPVKIPRTTVTDVHALVDYWNPVVQHGPDERPGDMGGLDRARGQWLAEMTLALATPTPVPQEILKPYARNAQFWHAMQTLSTELSVLKEAPTKWDLAKTSIEESAKHVAEKLGTTALDIGKYALIGASIIGGAILFAKVLGPK